MKVKFLIFQFLIFAALKAQIGSSYTLISPLSLNECNATGTSLGNNLPTPLNAKFTIIGQNGSNWIIYFLPWFSEKNNHVEKIFNSVNAELFNVNISPLAVGESSTNIYRNRKYFLLPKAAIATNCELIKTDISRLTFGFVTLPIKFRTVPEFEFTPNVQVGVAISYYLPKLSNPQKEKGLMLVGGINIGITTLDNLNTSPSDPANILKEPLKDVGILSPLVGVLYKTKAFQIGVFKGWDMLRETTDKKYNWIFNGRHYWGIGVGVSILDLGKYTVTAGSNK